MFSWPLILFLLFPWDLGIWVYFISCVAACVEWKPGSVSAVAQAWLISEQIRRICRSALQRLVVGFDWREWWFQSPSEKVHGCSSYLALGVGKEPKVRNL